MGNLVDQKKVINSTENLNKFTKIHLISIYSNMTIQSRNSTLK